MGNLFAMEVLLPCILGPRIAGSMMCRQVVAVLAASSPLWQWRLTRPRVQRALHGCLLYRGLALRLFVPARTQLVARLTSQFVCAVRLLMNET